MAVDLASLLPSLLPMAISWAEQQSAWALQSGRMLSPRELEVAQEVGVANSAAVRLVAVDQLPLPGDPVLREAAIQAGLLGPGMVGLTLGHAIFMVQGHCTMRLVSHELRHVHQYEQAGSIAAFLPGYLLQVVQFGYHAAPLEQDARANERTL